MGLIYFSGVILNIKKRGGIRVNRSVPDSEKVKASVSISSSSWESGMGNGGFNLKTTDEEEEVSVELPLPFLEPSVKIFANNFYIVVE